MSLYQRLVIWLLALLILLPHVHGWEQTIAAIGSSAWFTCLADWAADRENQENHDEHP